MTHLRRKVYHCIYLVSPVSVVGEPLKVDHKHLRLTDEKILLWSQLSRNITMEPTK